MGRCLCIIVFFIAYNYVIAYGQFIAEDIAGTIFHNKQNDRDPTYQRLESEVNQLLQIVYSCPDSAYRQSKRLYPVASFIGNKYLEGKILFYLAGLSLDMNKLNESSLYYKELLKLLSRTDSLQLAAVYHGLGSVYSAQGDLKGGMEYYIKALKTLPEKGKHKEMKYYSSIATVFLRQGQHTKAKYIYLKILTLTERKINNLRINEGIYSNLGLCYRFLGSADSADYYLNKALRISKELDSRKAIARNYHGLGLIANDRTYYQLARRYFDSAMQHVSNGEDCAGLHINIGVTYMREGRSKPALYHMQVGENMATNQNELHNKMVAYRYMAAIYNNLGKGMDAYRYLSKSQTIKDSLNDIAKEQAINKLELQYQNTEKDRQLTEQKLKLAEQKRLLATKENKLLRNKIWMYGIPLGCIIVLTIGVGKYRSKLRLRKKDLQNQEQAKEIERLTYKIEGETAERERIARELHDGVSVLLTAAQMTYNALGNEHGNLQYTETYKEVLSLLHRTSQEVRNVTHNLIPELLIRYNLPSAIKSFCDLISRRHEIQIEIQIIGDFSLMNEKYNHGLYRMVQELVHNIVKHARASLVYLQLTQHHGLLQLTVEDNGIGFDPDTAKKGMGLSNLAARVNEWKGQFNCHSVPGKRTTIEIEIPLT